jgi:hypothetical protein
MKPLRLISPRSIGRVMVGLFVLGAAGSAPAQYVVAPAPARIYQPTPRRYVQRPSPYVVRPGYQVRPALPYNLSPYTDDWSTGRHLPYPKPWMLPTRDPAYRGR